MTSTILGFSDKGREGALVLEVHLFPTVMAHSLISPTVILEGWRKGLCVEDCVTSEDILICYT